MRIAPASRFEDAPDEPADLYLQDGRLRLTPRAARFAEKLLRGPSQIQCEVRHAMLVALLDLTRTGASPTVAEWSARPVRSKDARTHSDVIEARLFVEACATFAASYRSGPT